MRTCSGSIAAHPRRWYRTHGAPNVATTNTPGCGIVRYGSTIVDDRATWFSLVGEAVTGQTVASADSQGVAVFYTGVTVVGLIPSTNAVRVVPPPQVGLPPTTIALEVVACPDGQIANSARTQCLVCAAGAL